MQLTTSFYMRMDAETREALEYLVQQQRQSRAALVTQLIRQAYQHSVGADDENMATHTPTCEVPDED